MTAKESELLSIVLEPGARAALIAVASSPGEKTATQIAREASLNVNVARSQLKRLVTIGLVRKHRRDKSFRYRIEAGFVRSL